MNTLIKLTCTHTWVWIYVCIQIFSSKQCISGRFVFRGGLCQHSEFVSVMSLLWWKAWRSSPGICSSDSKQCYKLSIRRLLFKESHFNHIFWFLWVWKLLLWVLLRTGMQKGLTQHACESFSSRSLLHFLKFAPVITMAFVCCKFSSLLLFHPRSFC